MTQTWLPRRVPRAVGVLVGLAVAVAATLLVAAPARASVNTIVGTVYDATSGLPATGVTVIATGPDDVQERAVTDVDGTYSIAPAYGFGSYDIEAGSDDYVWSPLSITEGPRSITFDATSGATDFSLERGRAITGIVRNAIDATTPLADIVVGATDSTGQVYFDRQGLVLFPGAPFGATGPDGLFRVTVPLGDEYEVDAIDFGGDYDPQGYDHVSLSGCGCDIDPVAVGTAWPASPVPDIDFDLRRFADWTWVSVLAQLPGAVAYPGVLIHLDEYDSGTDTWDLDVDSALTDATGFADVYGLGGGDYRLRYSVAGVFTSVVLAQDPSSTPFSTSAGGTVVDLPGLTAGAGCSCGFDETDVDLTFAAPSNGGSGGGGGTPVTPRKPHAAVTGFEPAAVTSTPTPTPAATPTPTASPTGDSTPSPKPTGPATTTTALDLSWLWIIVGIVLALTVVFFLIVFLRRRRP